MKEKLIKEFEKLMEKASDVNAMSLSEYKDFLEDCIDDMRSRLDAAESDEETE